MNMEEDKAYENACERLDDTAIEERARNLDNEYEVKKKELEAKRTRYTNELNNESTALVNLYFRSQIAIGIHNDRRKTEG